MSHVSVIGVINVTPDSYFDGGKYVGIESAVKRARECIEQGAEILEIGGESTGPGSLDVSVEEELKRVTPAIEAIRATLPDATLSVDTYKAEVASKAIDLGVRMVNDVTAGRGDPDMFSVIANADCRYVLMYAKDATARTTRENRRYDDVVETVAGFLSERLDAARRAGIAEGQIIVDPGLGHFVSARGEYSWEILRNLHTFTSLGPVLVSPSRKSFLAGPNNLPVSERLPATLAATTLALLNGARYIRTHDVKETVQVVEALRGVIDR